MGSPSIVVPADAAAPFASCAAPAAPRDLVEDQGQEEGKGPVEDGVVKVVHVGSSVVAAGVMAGWFAACPPGHAQSSCGNSGRASAWAG